MPETVPVRLRVNDREVESRVEARLLLSDFLRHELGLTGTHVGCEHGVCGACTVLVDGQAMRSCLLFAVQMQDQDVRTVEDLAPGPDELHALQQSFQDCHGLQCGFCTPGILMSTLAFVEETPSPSREQIREMLAAHLCRCTGYQKIVDAVEQYATARSRH